MHGISTDVVELYVYYILIMYYYVGYCMPYYHHIIGGGARGGGWQGEGPEGEVGRLPTPRGFPSRPRGSRLASLRASPRAPRQGL